MLPLPTIVHLDADAFFVSCELSLKPELRGTKCAVGGRERGIISSASYEARACGVYTPMPTKLALKVCPDLILLPHTAGIYSKKSREMFDLCETLTPVVQRNSVDEGYLDIGPCGFKTLPEIERRVRALQQRIWDDLQIPTSFGIAANKLVSAIASKARKPRGFTVVPPGEEAAFLAPLKISVIPGVGKKSEERLAASGIRLVSDVLTRSERELKNLFGSGWEEMLRTARGEDDRPVHTDHEDAKSYSVQETFGEDISDLAEIERIAKRMIDELMPAIRGDGKRVKTMTVKVRYPGMENSTAGRSLAEATDLEAPFYPLVQPLLKAAWTQRRPLRLVSVRFSGVEEKGSQLEMFAQTDEKKRRLAAVMDKLNAKGQAGIVRHGHQIQKED
ncbi:DNA polymerase IV [Opitutus sp. GAS368]|jgi:DNA polymerase-4|uniref:Y-family DNA polymerase n=1 Tax=Opitutus sp. GAS368 TaxID=1882749 RepID=UPI00087C9D8A|nr:DNA polymerase IV [Opitutus sp. GAS368]SDS56787.1 DNA polymerase-4 [Opitutus sp. GAS368]